MGAADVHQQRFFLGKGMDAPQFRPVAEVNPPLVIPPPALPCALVANQGAQSIDVPARVDGEKLGMAVCAGREGDNGAVWADPGVGPIAVRAVRNLAVLLVRDPDVSAGLY